MSGERVRPLPSSASRRTRSSPASSRAAAIDIANSGRCAGFDAEITKKIAINNAELEEEDADLKKPQWQAGKIRNLDFRRASLVEMVAKRLRACEALLDGYARCVFIVHDKNR